MVLFTSVAYNPDWLSFLFCLTNFSAVGVATLYLDVPPRLHSLFLVCLNVIMVCVKSLRTRTHRGLEEQFLLLLGIFRDLLVRLAVLVSFLTLRLRSASAFLTCSTGGYAFLCFE